MLGIERRQVILERLTRERKVYVSRLSDELGVTQETIRRDLEKLESGGHLQRSHGGAVLLTPSNEDISLANRASTNFTLKQIIAVKAAGLVNDGASLMVDSSSTVFHLFNLLTAKKDLAVITNSITLLNDFAGKDFDFVSTGGNFRPNSMCLVGSQAVRTLRRFNVDLSIVSCKGLDMRHGITESNEPEAEIKLVMARQAKSRVLLADHTKFDKAFFAKTLEYDDIDYIVTDRAPAEDWIEFFESHDIQLIY